MTYYVLKANRCSEQIVTTHTRNPHVLLPLTPIALEILLALGNGERHGYDIMLGIEERTDGRMSPNPGTLYRAIDRLVRDGLIDVADRRLAGGDWRRLFRLSRFGTRVAEAELARLADQVRAARGTRLLRPKKVAGA
jgi:DNA-binding PadR family transcriptional regulator